VRFETPGGTWVRQEYGVDRFLEELREKLKDEHTTRNRASANGALADGRMGSQLLGAGVHCKGRLSEAPRPPPQRRFCLSPLDVRIPGSAFVVRSPLQEIDS